MKTYLFQGDSITDAGRSRENNSLRGIGYPHLVASELKVDYPGQLNIINRGISGNRVVDLYARIKADFINLKPDYLSILIGVNDVWHEFSANPNGVDDAKYRRIYCMLIEELKEALPDLKIYILEPFTLKGRGNEAYFEEFDREVRLRAASAKWVAEKYGLTFIPLQQKFDELCEVCPADYWLSDGVHPAEAGHEIIARALLAEVKKDL